jgi:soluble lytic murein transglycosylase-like protein
MAYDWLNSGEGPVWVPALKGAEIAWKIPTLLLCRIAYQESHFQQEIIVGPPNKAGCVGLMQLNLEYYPNAGANTNQDIKDAAALLRQDFARFNDWQLAVASYDWGPGNVHKWLAEGADPLKLPQETYNYLVDVREDVPIDGQIFTA